MAKKKLNKKVAFIGLIFVGLISVALLAFFLSKMKNPEVILNDARAAVKDKDFKTAAKFYGEAIGNAKEQKFKIDVLFELADFFLITDPGDEATEREPKEANWPKALNCWKQVTLVDTANIEARKKLIDFFFKAADAGQIKGWDQVAQFSDEIIKIYEDKEIAPDSEILFIRGRALYESAQNSLVTDLEETVSEARKYLNQALEIDSQNLDIYKYLADNEILQGRLDDNAGKINAKENARQRANEILETAIAKSPENPKGYVNLLGLKLQQSLSDREKIIALEPEFEALMQKFPDSALVYKSAATYYQYDMTKLSKAVQAIEKAIELAPEDIDYQILASNIYYRKANIDSQPEYMEKAINAAKIAREMPEAQDTTGPKQVKHVNNKLIANSLLAKFYLEMTLDITDSAQQARKDELISYAEDNIHVIEQIIGVGEHRVVVKWKGLLDLAKGNQEKAISELYNSYKQFKDLGTPDPDVSFILAKIYEDTDFLGAQQEFLADALKGNIVQQGHPEALIKYIEILVKRKNSSNALNLIEQYELILGETPKTIKLKIKANINGNLFDEAELLLAKLDSNLPETAALQLEVTLARMQQLKQLKANEALQQQTQQDLSNSKYDKEIIKIAEAADGIIVNLTEKAPEMVNFSDVLNIANTYLSQGFKDKADKLVRKYSAIKPDNTLAKIYLRKLKLADPLNPTQEDIKTITLQSIEEITDPAKKALGLAQFYRGQQDLDKALEILMPYKNLDNITEGICKLMFDIALIEKDYDLAKELAEISKEKNYDTCRGNYFSARILLAQKEYKSAVDKLNEALKVQPVYPPANVLLSICQDNLGNLDLAIDQAQTAAKYNPFDASSARQLASVLYKRNSQLGLNVTQQQELETQNALLRAMSLEPGNVNLQSLYAEYIFDKDPRKALAMRQALQRNAPSVENAILLGNMAMRLAKTASNPEAIEAMLKVAEGSYEEALLIDPENNEALNAYSEYLRLTGQEKKIEELLAGKDEVRWKAYLRGAQYDKAKEILNKLYSENPETVEVIKGLMLVAQKTSNRKDVETYSEKLLAIDNSIDNQLAQIQAYLDLGILEKAKAKLYSFMEANPEESKALLLEASLFTRQGQFDKALNSINLILEKEKTDPLAWRLRAQINNLKGNYDQAIEDYSKAKSFSDDPIIKIELAKSHARNKQYDRAITELTVAMDEKGAPQITPVLLEQMYIENGNQAQLEKFYQKMIRRFPDNLYWKNKLADLTFKLGQESKALEMYQENWKQSLNLSKFGDPQTLNGYMNLLLETKNYSKLLSIASEYIDGPFAINIYNAMGKAKAALNDLDTASNYFGKALEKSSINRQLIAMTLNNFENSVSAKAIEQWYSAQLKSKPDSLNANIVAFTYLTNKGNYNKALPYIEECIKAAPNINVKNLFKMNKADLLQLQYNKFPDDAYLTQAISIYEELLALDQSNVSVLNNLSYLLATSGKDLDSALKYAKLAYALTPGNGMILDTYAFVLLQRGETDEALQLLLQSIQLFEVTAVSAPSEVYEHLGNANEKLGKNKEALAAYQTALEIGKDTLPKETIEKLNAAIERVKE